MQSSTPINVEQLEKELANHPDNIFVKDLINGLRHGFDTGIENVPTTSLICPNLLSARAEPDVVSELLVKEVQKGYLLGPFEEPPFETYRFSPIGMATGKYSGKKRLIVDLSSPHDSDVHPSLNELIKTNTH